MNQATAGAKDSFTMPAVYDCFPASQVQSVEHSPTATPFHTRAGSPAHEELSDQERSETMTALSNALHAPSLNVNEDNMDNNARVKRADGSANVLMGTKVNYLLIYFILNLGLTIYNKAIMIKVRKACSL